MIWHLVDPRGKTVATIHGESKAGAIKLGQRLANKFRVQLRLKQGMGDNPATRLPRVGEVWRGLMGDRCRIVKVSGSQVTVLQLDSGHRVSSHLSDFLATYKPPREPARLNPKRKGRKRNPAGRMPVTAYERTEWSRAAKAMYARGENALGHLLSAAAAAHDLPIGRWDRAAEAYRAWLVFDEPKRNPSRSSAARARRKAIRSGLNRKTYRAAARTARLTRAHAFPGAAAKPVHYLHAAIRRRAARSKPNPKGRPTTVREAIAEVIDAAKFPVVAKEVRSGKQDPVKSLEFVRKFMSTERQRAIVDQALRLARRFPGRLMDSPAAGPHPNPKRRVHSAPRRKGNRSPSTARRGRARRNPRSSEVERAKETYRMWSEQEPQSMRRVKAPHRVPTAMAQLGELVEVVYRSDKYDGKSKLYKHTTRRPRPVLAADPDGRHVFIVGGNMKVTADGLVN